MLVRKPAKKIIYPPVHQVAWRDKHDYTSGDSWTKVADKYGIQDPWDLIVYNFQCRNPEEVNWCMQEFFGCTKSKDGMNYSFDSSDVPAVPRPSAPARRIYIPPVGWQAFTADDRDARDLVLASLKHPHRRLINFRLNGLRVEPDLFKEVLQHVASHTILIYSIPPAAAQQFQREHGVNVRAFYNFSQNTLLLRAPHRPTLDNLTAVIHEAVHAGFDVRKLKVLNADNEACGFIAGAVMGLSFHAGLSSFDAFRAPAFAAEPHLQWAAHIARKVLLHQRGSSRSAFVVSDSDHKEIKGKIMASPAYRKTASKTRKYGGV